MSHAPTIALNPEPDAAAPRPGRAWASPRLDSRVVLGGIMGLAAVLRFAGLGHNSLWFDEAFVVWVGAHLWAGDAVLAVLMVYTQYLGFLVLFAHGVWVAGWERRHLGAWLASMGVAAVLYAPWIPAAWHQAGGQYGRAWPPHALF